VAAYYLDTSALVKRYAVEQGSIWVVAIAARTAGHELFTTRSTGPETVAALFRKVRTGEASRGLIASLAAEFRVDWSDQYRIVELSPHIADEAMDLTERHGLRGYDAVHLATALTVERERRASGLAALTFVSADMDQLQAAVAEGLLVDNPNSHP
jgi:predicted nucleic acid-binding protein